MLDILIAFKIECMFLYDIPYPVFRVRISLIQEASDDRIPAVKAIKVEVIGLKALRLPP